MFTNRKTSFGSTIGLAAIAVVATLAVGCGNNHGLYTCEPWGIVVTDPATCHELDQDQPDGGRRLGGAGAPCITDADCDLARGYTCNGGHCGLRGNPMPDAGSTDSAPPATDGGTNPDLCGTDMAKPPATDSGVGPCSAGQMRLNDGTCVPINTACSDGAGNALPIILTCCDGRKNGKETDVDCGGPDCNEFYRCRVQGQTCAVDLDCNVNRTQGYPAGLKCVAGTCQPR